MEVISQLKRGLSGHLSPRFLMKSIRFSFKRQTSFDPCLSNTNRFAYGRQSSLDPNRRNLIREELKVPENLDSTMQLLFMASRGDVSGVEELLKEGVDVNSIDLDGRTALHIAACEGQVEVVKLLLSWKVNIEARDRWRSTAASDAQFYRNVEVYNLLRARGAKLPKTRKTPMAVSNPQDVPEYEVNPADLQFQRGEDIFKNTHQVVKWNGTKVLVKILNKDFYIDPESINDFKHELTLLQKVRHPNLVQFLGAVTQNPPMMIISEYHPKGDLQSYLQKKGRLKVHKVLRFSLDIARGMNYLHECKPDPVIHCSLSPKNIFLDDAGQLKVAGFDLKKLSRISPDKAKLVHPLSNFNNLCLYMAPEVYKNNIFDKKVDVFSFALILYEDHVMRRMIESAKEKHGIYYLEEMMDGAPPFHPKGPEDAVKMICLEGMRPALKFKFRSYPADLKELIEECWNGDSTLRPTFAEIIVRLEKMYANCSKQGRWKTTLSFLGVRRSIRDKSAYL